MNIRPSLLAAAGLIAASIAFPIFAQDKKAAEPLVKFNIPLDNCVKPPMPEKNDSAAKQKQFSASMDDYRNCLSEYTGELRRYSEAHNKAAASYINAANMAVEEYNAYIKAVSATFEADKAASKATNTTQPPPPANRTSEVNSTGYQSKK